MKLISFKYSNNDIISWGILKNDHIIDLDKFFFDSDIDYDMFDFFYSKDFFKKNNQNFNDYKIGNDEIFLLSPILNPTSLRDAYAFRQHVEAGRKSRGLDMIPEYDKFPVFYYGNHNAIGGPGIVEIQKEHSMKLDYELEIAAIIGKEGKNISVDDADDYIFEPYQKN